MLFYETYTLPKRMHVGYDMKTLHAKNELAFTLNIYDKCSDSER